MSPSAGASWGWGQLPTSHPPAGLWVPRAPGTAGGAQGDSCPPPVHPQGVSGRPRSPPSRRPAHGARGVPSAPRSPRSRPLPPAVAMAMRQKGSASHPAMPRACIPPPSIPLPRASLHTEHPSAESIPLPSIPPPSIPPHGHGHAAGPLQKY